MSEPPEDKRFWIYVEDVLIVLAIPVLWLRICNVGGEFTNWVLFVTLVVLAVVFFRRINRIRRRAGD